MAWPAADAVAVVVVQTPYQQQYAGVVPVLHRAVRMLVGAGWWVWAGMGWGQRERAREAGDCGSTSKPQQQEELLLCSGSQGSCAGRQAGI